MDAAWLRMDSDAQRMMITTILRFDGVLTFAEVEALVRARLLAHKRFRQRVVESSLPGVGPSWEEDPRFTLSSHLHRAALPAPHDESALTSFASELASQVLDPRAPLWQMHVIEDAPGGTALVTRIHHAVGDGVSLVRLLLSITDEGDAAAPAAVGLTLAPAPSGLAQRVRLVADHAATLAHLVALPSDAKTQLRGELCRDKRLAVAPPLSIASLKRAGAPFGAKVNDVLLSLAAGATRRYLIACGAAVDELELRALVPVFFQGFGAVEALGNHFGLVFAPLLVGIADPVARLRAVKARMDALKVSSEAIVSLEVLALMGAAGPDAERLGIDVFTRKASMLLTNVPGPVSHLHLAGKTLVDLIVWAPVAGHVGVGVSMVSYGGAVRVGVLSDALRVPDPDAIAAGFHSELAALEASSIGA